MSFSERAKLTALAIVHIFETSKPFGDYAAVAVLRDGAGVSYGINQFTHRSGSLRAVLDRFHHLCRAAGSQLLLEGYGPMLGDTSPNWIIKMSQDQRFKNGLREAAKRPEMQQAQREIAFEKYLKPAIEACEGSDFTLPLSLAVVYDSINHGSYARIRDRVTFQGPGNGSIKPIEFEKEWITEYVRRRDAWLENHPNPLLRQTDYRTDFFLAQIARNNWNLDLPVNVHGYRLTDNEIQVAAPSHFEDLRDDEIELDVPTLAAVPAAGTPEPVTEIADAVPATGEDYSAAKPPIFVGDGRQGAEAVGFKAEKFTAYIPQIDTAKMWIKRATAGTTVGAVLAFVFQMPVWLQIGLFSLLVVIVIGAAVVFVKYHDKIFGYITEMNRLRAASDTHDPEISSLTP